MQLNDSELTIPEEQTIEDTQEPHNPYPIQIDFGGNKILNFRPWLGKERRLLQKILIGESEDHIETVLIYNCMETLTYLTKREIAFAMLKLFSVSYDNKLAKTCTCSSCGKNSEVVIELDNILSQVKVSKFSDINTDKYKFVINPQASYSDKFMERQLGTSSDFDKVFNELCIHLSEIYEDGAEFIPTSFEELINYVDILPVKVFDELFNEYDSMAFSFLAITTYVCKEEECNTENVEIIDVVEELISNFFL